MPEGLDFYSENPRWVLFWGRGGYLRVGEFLEFLEGYRIRVLTAPGTKIPTTIINESSKLSPQETAETCNRLLEKVAKLEAMMSEKTKEELGDDVPGLNRATEHIMIRMSIALDDLLGEATRSRSDDHNREWFQEEMRQTIRYFVWLYVKAACVSLSDSPPEEQQYPWWEDYGYVSGEAPHEPEKEEE